MEKGKLNLTNILLSIIGALLSLSVVFLSNMNDKLNNIDKAQAVQDSQIQAMKAEQTDLKTFYQQMLMEAKKEDEYTVPKNSK